MRSTIPCSRYTAARRTIADHTVRATVAFGVERTLEQDPMFAFRILVDIALKALSPAINDPTTAVLAIDQIHRLLRMLGKRALRGEVIADSAGAPRLIFRTPNWEDYVHIACNEIRACGGGSMQIMRRMRAMIENLLVSLPERRHPSLLRELRYLDLTIDEKFVLAEDRALARIADAQGLGGSTVIAGKDRVGRWRRTASFPVWLLSRDRRHRRDGPRVFRTVGVHHHSVCVWRRRAGQPVAT